VISKRLVELIHTTEDFDIQEKAILAIGVCGDESQETLDVLLKLLDTKQAEDSLRVAAALVLGKQAYQDNAKVKEALTKCQKESPQNSLKTACQLGYTELEGRKPAAQKPPTPPPAPKAEASTEPEGEEKN